MPESKDVLVKMPAGVVERLDFIAAMEDRSRASLIRRMIRDGIDAHDRQIAEHTRAASA